MRLPDFTQDPAMIRLWENMGVETQIPVDGGAWKDWDGFGIDIGDAKDIVANPDGTLSYEGRRVLVYIRDQQLANHDRVGDYRFHVAECRTLEQMRRQKRFARYVVTTRIDGRFVVNLFRWGLVEPVQPGELIEMKVCKNCLERLDWSGYQGAAQPGRIRIWKDFDPKDFMSRYGTYVARLPTQSAATAPLQTYPANWSTVSASVRASVGWRCQECAGDFSSHQHRQYLHAHHVDGNKANSHPSNLRALCLGCHAKEPAHSHLRNHPSFPTFLSLYRAGTFG